MSRDAGDPIEHAHTCGLLEEAADALNCIRGVVVPAVAGRLHEQLELIRTCGGFPKEAMWGCYSWFGRTLSVVTDGRFETSRLPPPRSAARALLLRRRCAAHAGGTRHVLLKTDGVAALADDCSSADWLDDTVGPLRWRLKSRPSATICFISFRPSVSVGKREGVLQRRVTLEAPGARAEVTEPTTAIATAAASPTLHASEYGSARRMHMDRTSHLLERRIAKHGREVGHVC